MGYAAHLVRQIPRRQNGLTEVSPAPERHRTIDCSVTDYDQQHHARALGRKSHSFAYNRQSLLKFGDFM
jgi:hypothetical protein